MDSFPLWRRTHRDATARSPAYGSKQPRPTCIRRCCAGQFSTVTTTAAGSSVVVTVNAGRSAATPMKACEIPPGSARKSAETIVDSASPRTRSGPAYGEKVSSESVDVPDRSRTRDRGVVRVGRDLVDRATAPCAGTARDKTEYQ